MLDKILFESVPRVSRNCTTFITMCEQMSPISNKLKGRTGVGQQANPPFWELCSSLALMSDETT